MKLLKRRRRYLAIVLAFGIALGMSGIAAAYFSGGVGTGAGSATVTKPFAFTVAQHNRTGVTGPGDPTVITFAIGNTGAFKEVATNPQATVVTKGGDITSTGLKVTTCKSAWFHAVATPTFRRTTGMPVGTHPFVTPNHNVRDAVTVTMTTSGTTQGACAGKTPAVRFTVGP